MFIHIILQIHQEVFFSILCLYDRSKNGDRYKKETTKGDNPGDRKPRKEIDLLLSQSITIVYQSKFFYTLFYLCFQTISNKSVSPFSYQHSQNIKHDKICVWIQVQILDCLSNASANDTISGEFESTLSGVLIPDMCVYSLLPPCLSTCVWFDVEEVHFSKCSVTTWRYSINSFNEVIDISQSHKN